MSRTVLDGTYDLRVVTDLFLCSSCKVKDPEDVPGGLPGRSMYAPPSALVDVLN
jgi:hypothetical protein